jgi:dihydrofolate reductase
MRKLILCMQVTLDGYVEGPKGDMSWMQPDDDEAWDDLFGMLSNTVDLFLLGRGMWPEYRDYWKKALAEPDKFSVNELKYAQLAERTQHVVFSKTLKNSGWENTCVNHGNLAEEIKKIKAGKGKAIQIVGGADFAAALIDLGVVDEYRILLNPAIVGGGKSFFHQLKNRQNLQLTDVKKLSNQVLVLNYKPLAKGEKYERTPQKRRAHNNPAT